LTQYCPPCDDRPTATTVVVGLADSKQHPIKELRGGPAKVSDFCAHHQPLRKMTVKETHHVVRSEDFDGNKMINEYVRESKIGTGSYGKVVSAVFWSFLGGVLERAIRQTGCRSSLQCVENIPTIWLE
jgi:hypothetical protein